MGHTPLANDMAARYRQRVSDERLETVAEHVRRWLFPNGVKAAKKKVPVKKVATIKKGKRVVKA